MSFSVFVLCMAAAAVIASMASLVVGLAIFGGDRFGPATSPATRARLLFVGILLPGIIAVVMTLIALAPSFGLLHDHCPLDPEAHRHLCLTHHIAGLPSIPVLLLALGLASRIVHRCARLVRASRIGRKTRVVLDASVTGRTAEGFHVLPSPLPQAFVLGAFRPVAYVTSGLIEGADQVHFGAIAAHEMAHIRRRDGLRQILAGLALAFHLPPIARMLSRQLADAHEMAADLEAATILGSRDRVARALVHVARANRHGWKLGLAFGRSAIEARIEGLLDERTRRDFPSASALGLLLSAGLALSIACAEPIHDGIELVLRAIGG